MLRALIRRSSRDLLDWLLPAECLLCRSATSTNPQHVPSTICAGCFQNLFPASAAACESCGAALGPHADPAGNCPHCHGQQFRFGSVTCLGMYEGPLRTLLLAGKWSSSSNSLRTLARAYVAAHGAELCSLNVERIIPIPQIWHRRFLRNFNAATVLATEIGRYVRRPVDVHVLRRSRGTPPQKRASLNERRAIQRGAFRIRDPHVIQGERILLVDDVLTTGATCDEATRMLNEAGARECHVAVLARVAGSAR